MTLNEIITSATHLGRIAAESNEMKIPFHDPGVMPLIRECDKLGSPSLSVVMLTAWHDGYQAVRDGETAKILESL